MLLAFLPVVILEINTAADQENRAAENVRAESGRLSRLFASNQEALIDSSRQMLTLLSKLDRLQRRDSAACQQLFDRLRKENPFFSVVGMAELNGEVFCTSPLEKDPVNVSDRMYFQRALQTKGFVVGDFTISRTAQKPTLHLAMPLMDPEGTPTAVIYIGLDLTAIS